MDSSSPIAIRRGVESDAESLFRIHVDAVESQCAATYSEEQIRRWFEGRNAAEYVGHLSRGRIWVATAAELLLGFTECWPGHIDRMFVSRWAAGRGVGGNLIRFALTRAFSEGFAAVKIEATLNAQPFYEKHGFRKNSNSSFVQTSGIVIETVLMEITRPHA